MDANATTENPERIPTLEAICDQLDTLLAFIGKVREGKPIVWENTETGKTHTATRSENLAYIEELVLMIACDVESLQTHVLHLAGEAHDDTH